MRVVAARERDEGADGAEASSRPALRRDAAANRERVLQAATAAVHREGEKVPIATIAADAGVGVATVYRSFPTREALLAALSHRAFLLVLGHAQRATRRRGPALAAVASFFESVLRDRDELVLPLHGGPVDVDPAAVEVQTEIRSMLRSLLDRGREDGSIRQPVSAGDLIIAGAQFASPLPNVADWDRVARRQMRVYLSGLGAEPVAAPSADQG